MNLIIFLLSFLIALFATKLFIRKFRNRGIMVKDKYKLGTPEIPNLGGLGVLMGIIAGSVVSLFFVSDTNFLIFYFIVMMFALFTLTDDLIDIGRKVKIFVPIFLALPVMLAFDNFYLVIPLYVMVVANLINMHSGYNGLQIGLSSILLITIGIKTGWGYFLMPVLGATLAFWWFDHYPSRIFIGNIGSFAIGSSIGILLVLNGLKLFGIVILIPHTVNFLLYVYWRLFKTYSPREKFGKIRADGTIEVPHPLTLKWIFPFYFRLTEKQSTYLMYLLTAGFCLVGLVFF